MYVAGKIMHIIVEQQCLIIIQSEQDLVDFQYPPEFAVKESWRCACADNFKRYYLVTVMASKASLLWTTTTETWMWTCMSTINLELLSVFLASVWCSKECLPSLSKTMEGCDRQAPLFCSAIIQQLWRPHFNWALFSKLAVNFGCASYWMLWRSKSSQLDAVFENLRLWLCLNMLYILGL